MSLTGSDFVDVLAGSASAGALIDFYIGSDGQERVRNRLQAWWGRFLDVRMTNFGREEALFAIEITDRLFGAKFFSFRRLLSTVTVGIVAAAATIALPWLIIFFRDQAPIYAFTLWYEIIILLISFAFSISATRYVALLAANLLKRDSWMSPIVLCDDGVPISALMLLAAFCRICHANDIDISDDFR